MDLSRDWSTWRSTVEILSFELSVCMGEWKGSWFISSMRSRDTWPLTRAGDTPTRLPHRASLDLQTRAGSGSEREGSTSVFHRRHGRIARGVIVYDSTICRRGWEAVVDSFPRHPSASRAGVAGRDGESRSRCPTMDGMEKICGRGEGEVGDRQWLADSQTPRSRYSLGRGTIKEFATPATCFSLPRSLSPPIPKILKLVFRP